MIRHLFAIVLFLSTLFSTTIEVKKGVNIDPVLLKKFKNYWKNRGERKFDRTYIQELPYLKYLHSKSWYKKFFADAPKFKKVILKKVHSCNSTKCVLGILLFRDSSSSTYLYDTWIKVNGVWYHRYNDSPLPVI